MPFVAVVNTCQYCGQTFTHRWQISKFCSLDCNNAYHDEARRVRRTINRMKDDITMFRSMRNHKSERLRRLCDMYLKLFIADIQELTNENSTTEHSEK